MLYLGSVHGAGLPFATAAVFLVAYLLVGRFYHDALFRRRLRYD
jgi:hypothetical protein